MDDVPLVPLERHAFFIVAKMNSAERASVPRCVALDLAQFIGIKTPSTDCSTDIILKKIAEIRTTTAPDKIRVPPPQSELVRLAANKRDKKTASLRSKYSAGDMARVLSLVNPEKKWRSSVALMRAARHLFVFDAACRAVATLTELPPPLILSADASVTDAGGARETIAFSNYWLAENSIYGCVEEGARLGGKSDSDPLSYDSVMLFTACHSLGVPTLPADSIHDLAARIGVRKMIRSFTPTHSAIVSLILKNHSPNSCDECSDPRAPARRAVVARAVEAIGTPAPIHPAHAEVCVPVSDGAACAYAAILFGLNLMDAECPLTEFYQCVALAKRAASSGGGGPPALEWFRPVSIGTWFGRVFAETPGVFDVRENWSSAFFGVYHPDELAEFAVQEGFDCDGDVLTGDETPASSAEFWGASGYTTALAFPSVLSALGHAEATCTVVVGHHPKATNTTSPYVMDYLDQYVSEHGPNSILSFGSPLERMVAVSVTDVIYAWANTNSFVLSIGLDGANEFLPRRVVNKLKRIAHRYLAGENSSDRELYEALLRQIRIVEARSAGNTFHAKELAKAAERADAPTREAMREALTALLKAGMYMRGWGVAAPPPAQPGNEAQYPLRSVDTTYAPERQCEVDVNVTMAIHAYDGALEAIADPETRRLIRAAPLLKAVRLRRGRGGDAAVLDSAPAQFVPPLNGDQQGFSIEDRVAILREGEASETVFSCLRMSSNFIVASAYYYLSVSLREDPGFNIAELSEIS